MPMDENEPQSKKKLAQLHAADFESEIKSALIDQAYSQLPPALLSNFLLSPVLIAILWEYLPGSVPLLWISVVWVISLLRILLYSKYQHQNSMNKTLPIWEYLFVAAALISALAWGFSGIFLFSEQSVAHQILLAFVLGGLVSGSTVSMAAMQKTVRAYILFMLAPLTIRFFYLSEPVYIGMGVMMTIYAVLNMAMSFNAHKMLIESLNLRHENQEEIEARKKTEAELRSYKENLENIVVARTRELVQSNYKLVNEISERKKIEEQLRKSEEKFRNIFFSSTVAIWEQDFSLVISLVNKLKKQGVEDFHTYFKKNPGIIIKIINSIENIDANSAAVKMHRAKNKTQLFSNFKEILSSHAVDTIAQLVITFAEGKNHFEKETLLNTFNGRQVNVFISVFIPDKSSELRSWLIFITDITSYKQIQLELLKIQKLESLALLAGGIAHDFNNILAAILGNLSIASNELGADHGVYPLLEQAEKATARAKDLSYQLLTFAKGGEPIKEISIITDIIKESAEFILRGTRTNCVFNFDDNLWAVEIDPGQISQVIQNILLNASHSMPDGGEVKVSVANFNNKNGENKQLDKTEYIRIIIKDNGSGIEKKLLSNIFDPYFTTKDEGVGLGLAITHSIINKHHGYIMVESSLNIGTEFSIFLPASSEFDKNTHLAINSSPNNDVSIQGEGVVLVMDDGEMMLNVMKNMLLQLGYKPLLSRNGDEAIEIFQKCQNAKRAIVLVILDLTVVGGMGGKDAAAKILEINPAAKILISSGYSDDPVMANYQDYGFKFAIKKPFRLHELGTAIKRVLSGDTEAI